MSHKGGEKLELERCERDLGLVEDHVSPGEVDRQAIVVVVLLQYGRARSGSASEQSLHARNQLLTAEGLDDVVVGTRLQTAHSLELRTPRGQHDYRYVADIPDSLERLPAVQVPHRHVENDE